MALHQGTMLPQLHLRFHPVYDKIFEKPSSYPSANSQASPRLATWCFPRCRRPPGYHPMSARDTPPSTPLVIADLNNVDRDEQKDVVAQSENQISVEVCLPCPCLQMDLRSGCTSSSIQATPRLRCHHHPRFLAPSGYSIRCLGPAVTPYHPPPHVPPMPSPSPFPSLSATLPSRPISGLSLSPLTSPWLVIHDKAARIPQANTPPAARTVITPSRSPGLRGKRCRSSSDDAASAKQQNESCSPRTISTLNGQAIIMGTQN